MEQDRLSSLARVRAAGQLRQPDSVPVAPYLGNHGARVAGAAIDQYCRSGKLMAEAQYCAWELYQQDMVVPQSDNYYIAEGFGVRVDHHPDSTPTLSQPAIQDLADVTSLRVPDPQKDGRMPVYLEAIQRLADVLKGNVAVRAPGTGPFSLASHLMGTENFLVELAYAERKPGGKEEERLRRLLDLATDALIAFAKACVDAGAHVVQAGDSLASIDMISPRQYRQWAFPCEQRFFGELNVYAGSRGALTLLHICGNMTPVLEDMANTGAQILELDSKVSLRSAKERVGDRVCLMGNLNPVELLLRGTPGEVERAASEAISEAGKHGGFILGSGCEVPVDAPPENLKAMVRIARSQVPGDSEQAWSRRT
ncbi:MAG: uroporphyrinogen decarboxylase family protein [Verrucomicrobiia bacterium]